jgi:hypothetical protein
MKKVSALFCLLFMSSTALADVLIPYLPAIEASGQSYTRFSIRITSEAVRKFNLNDSRFQVFTRIESNRGTIYINGFPGEASPFGYICQKDFKRCEMYFYFGIEAKAISELEIQNLKIDILAKETGNFNIEPILLGTGNIDLKSAQTQYPIQFTTMGKETAAQVSIEQMVGSK